MAIQCIKLTDFDSRTSLVSANDSFYLVSDTGACQNDKSYRTNIDNIGYSIKCALPADFNIIDSHYTTVSNCSAKWDGAYDLIQSCAPKWGSVMGVGNGLDKIYPVDSVFISLSSANPATYGFPGSWSQFAQGKVILGQASVTGGGDSTTTTTVIQQPNPHSYSGYFNGRSYLKVPAGSQFNFNSKDFTVEFWVNTAAKYADGSDNHADIFFSIYSPASNAPGPGEKGLQIGCFTFSGCPGINPTTKYSTKISVGVGWWPIMVITGNKVVADGKWHHIAVVRTGSALKLFVDGIQSGNTANLTDNRYCVSPRNPSIYGQLAPLPFNEGGLPNYYLTVGGNVRFGPTTIGYISNLRIVKGQALYTGTFTPPTAPLTIGSVGTTTGNVVTSLTGTQSLLTLQDCSFVDNSTFTSLISNTPSTRIIPQIGYTSPFSADTNSVYFNGKSYLTSPASEDFNFSTGNFTIECWVNTSVSTYVDAAFRRLLSFGTNNSSANLQLAFLKTNGTVTSDKLGVYTNSQLIEGSIIVANGLWHHVSVTRVGTTLKLFIDGVQSGATANISSSLSFSGGGTLGLTIGCYGDRANGFFNGYISNLRIVKGQALYTGDFIPSTTPLTNTTVGATGAGVPNPNIGGLVSLLTLQSDCFFVDNSQTQKSIQMPVANYVTTTQASIPFNSTTLDTEITQTVTVADTFLAGQSGGRYCHTLQTVETPTHTHDTAVLPHTHSSTGYFYGTTQTDLALSGDFCSSSTCTFIKTGPEMLANSSTAVTYGTYPAGCYLMKYHCGFWSGFAVIDQWTWGGAKIISNGIDKGTLGNGTIYTGGQCVQAYNNGISDPGCMFSHSGGEIKTVYRDTVYTDNRGSGYADLYCVSNTQGCCVSGPTCASSPTTFNTCNRIGYSVDGYSCVDTLYTSVSAHCNIQPYIVAYIWKRDS